MKRNTQMKSLFLLFLLTLTLCFTFAEPVSAASKPMSVTSCSLNKSGKKLTVKAKVVDKTSATKKKLYLIGINAYNSESKDYKTTPLASAKVKRGKVSFSVKYKSSMLYKKFAVAYKVKGKYRILSDCWYITNPEVLATYTGSGPKTTSKKGLQVEELSEAVELGTQHAVINWTMDSLLTTKSSSNRTAYKYRGKTYYFDTTELETYDNLVSSYNAAGARVTIILLLRNNDSTATASMRYNGPDTALFSCFKTTTGKGCRTFEATMTFLAKRYGVKGRLVSGWILGNEVDSPGVWNYTGGKSLSNCMKEYARAFRICYNAVKSVNKNAKVYISLDYNWSLDADLSGNSYFSAKSTLDTFYKKINAQGKIPFQIAYHAYPQGLVDPVFWDDSMAWDSTDSTLITMKNIQVLTNYVKKNFGKAYTIMLSEQSFNSTSGEETQAAAYAYAYYICDSNSMIESFIYGRQIDNSLEFASNCYWGLSDVNHEKRLIWDVFQYIDTKYSLKFTEPYLKYTNLSSWNQISGFKRSKYKKLGSPLTKVKFGSLYSDSASSATMFWYKVDQCDGYEIYRDGVKVKTVKDASNIGYRNKKLTSGETYSYKIRAFKYAPSPTNVNKKVKIYGSFSKKKKVTISTAQVTWSDPACSVSGNEITLHWKKQKNVSGYEVCRSTSYDGKYKRIATTTSATYTDTTTSSGKIYYYKVRAYITKGGKNYYGSYSGFAGAQADIKLDVTVSDNTVSLSWQSWPDAEGYRIFATSSDDNTYKKLKTTTSLSYDTKKYVDASGNKVAFTAGETYLFRVRAYMSDGSLSPYSNVVTLQIPSTYGKTAKSKKAAEDTEELEPTEATETIEGTESIEDTESTEGTETIEDTESTENIENTEATETTEATESTEGTESIENTENTEDTDTTENTETTESTETTENTETTKSTETTDATEATESVENTETTKSTEHMESADATETM